MAVINKFYIQKRGNAPDENEDASVYGTAKNKRDCVRFAVADGATESSFSKLWAEILIKSYITYGFKSYKGVKSKFPSLSKKWSSEVDNKQLPWFAEEKARAGAYATFLGLEIEGITLDDNNNIVILPNKKKKWNCIALGDCCLFQWKKSILAKSFPITSYERFTNFPDLLSSRPHKNTPIWDKILTDSGNWELEDTFLLSTDAFSAWVLKKISNRMNPYNEIISLANNKDRDSNFSLWTEKEIKATNLKNDDITCLIIQL